MDERLERVARALAQHDFPSVGFDGMAEAGQRDYRAKAAAGLAELEGELINSERYDFSQTMEGQELVIRCFRYVGAEYLDRMIDEARGALADPEA